MMLDSAHVEHGASLPDTPRKVGLSCLMLAPFPNVFKLLCRCRYGSWGVSSSLSNRDSVRSYVAKCALSPQKYLFQVDVYMLYVSGDESSLPSILCFRQQNLAHIHSMFTQIYNATHRRSALWKTSKKGQVQRMFLSSVVLEKPTHVSACVRLSSPPTLRSQRKPP